MSARSGLLAVLTLSFWSVLTIYPCAAGNSWWFCLGPVHVQGKPVLACLCDDDFRGQSPQTREWLPLVLDVAGEDVE